MEGSERCTHSSKVGRIKADMAKQADGEQAERERADGEQVDMVNR